MLDVFATYATDESAELAGVWQPLGDAKLLIARSGNRNYVRALTKSVEAHQNLLNDESEEANKLSDKLMAEVIGDTILLDWENLGYKGAPLAYSKDNARLLLAHKDFRAKVMQLAENVEAYRAKVEAEQVKN